MKFILTEAQFISLFGDNNFFQDGAFSISNEEMEKAREILYPYYDKIYNRNKSKVLHQIAFSTTMRMVDNGESLPEFNDFKTYHSFTNKTFSKEQVSYIEKNIIYPKYENCSLEELYDKMIIDTKKSSYDLDEKCKKSVYELIDNGFFDEYLNGQIKPLALWSIGKLNDVTDMFGWLWSNNKFTKEINYKTMLNQIKNTKDEIADSDESFTENKIFLGLTWIEHALSMAKKKGK